MSHKKVLLALAMVFALGLLASLQVNEATAKRGEIVPRQWGIHREGNAHSKS